MTAYLSVLREDEITGVLDHLSFLGLFSIALIVAAALSFPKRGQTV